MKIDEILLSPGLHSTPFDWDRVDWSHSEFVNTIDDLMLMKVESHGYLIYYLTTGAKRIGAVVLQKVKTPKGIFLQSNLTYIDPEYRGQNIAVKVYIEIRNREGIRLISDATQTDDGKKIWDKLSSEVDVYAINVKTGEVLPRNQVSDEVLYKKDEKENDWMLITENKGAATIMFGTHYQEGDLIKPAQKY